MRHLLDDVVNPIADDGSPPRCCGVNGYLHPDHMHLVMGLKGTVAVDGDRPIIVESDESGQELLWEPQAVSARGLEEAILTECTVGVVIQAHLKNSDDTISNLKEINSEK
jgi:hypothetical protein